MFNRVSTAILVLELLAIALAFFFVSWTPRKAAAGAIIIAAMLLLIAARRELRSAFSVRARASHLVTTGVYARIRNPIYLAGVLLLAGLALFFRSWLLLALDLVLTFVQWKRAGNEAGVLQQQFGKEYLEYRRHTWL